jgi:hypothetical protein
MSPWEQSPYDNAVTEGRPRDFHRPARRRLMCACLVAVLAVSSAAQERPLPDYAAFMAETRKRLEADDVRQSDYVYVATQREQKLDASFKATTETLNVFESYPALPNEPRWRRQIVKDGKPVPAEELAKVDRDRQKKVMDYANTMQRNPEKLRAAEQKKRDDERRDSQRAVDDLPRVYDIRMVGREMVSGYETILLSFAPRKDARPQTSEGRIMRHFAGKAWVSESDYEVVRVEAEAIETASFGLGLLARVYKGSKATYERRKVNGEQWLPARATYTAAARVMLVKVLRIGGTVEFSDYRKFSVQTETKIGKPQ